MSLPNVNEAIKDGGLGMIAPANSGVFGIVGNASAGNNEEIYILNDPATAEDTFEAGSMLERINDAFGTPGATKIIAVRADPTGGTAAASGTTTPDGSNTSTGTVTTSGTPKSDRDFKLIVTSGGVDGSIVGGGVKIKISQNGGSTYNDVVSLGSSSPQTVALGNGSNVVLTDHATPASSFVADDSWTWECTEAKPTTQKVLDAVEILAENNEIAWIHVCDATDGTFWASISTFNAELKLKHKYIRFLLESDRPTSSETTDQWITALNSDSAAFFDKDVVVNAGWGFYTDRNGNKVIRNGAGIIDGLRAQGKVNESIGWVGGKPVKPMLSLYPTDLSEAQIETLDETGRYATFRFWPGHGFRATGGRTMASITSDYQYDEYLAVLYKGVKLVRTAAVPFVNSVADTAGLIALQKTCEAPVDSMVSNDEIDGFEVLIPAGQNVVSLGEVKVQLTMVVKGIMRTISITFGLGKLAA
jgi:hypothetical protein